MAKQSFIGPLLVLSFAFTARAADDLSTRLQEGDRLAWLTDWYAALPICADVEKSATRSADCRDAMYAKFGGLRGRMQTLPRPEISEQITKDLSTALAKRDAKLRLRGRTVKGDIDLEWDVQAAQARLGRGAADRTFWVNPAGRTAQKASSETSHS
jgi:hypothetical protein